MNIGIFTDTYYPQINGVVTSIKMLEKELNNLGHQVFIITTTDPNCKRTLPRVFRLPSMPFIFLPSHRMAFMYSPKLLLRIKRLKLDIVHTQTEFPVGIFGKLVSEFCRIPNVHTYHTMYEDYVHYIANGHLITPKMAKKFSRIFCNRAKVVIAPVQKTKESLINYGVARPIEVIPTGIDFAPFDRNNFTQSDIDAAKTEIGLDLTAPVIIFIGRVAKEKSIDVIIKAMPKLLEKIPNAKFVVIGPGPYMEELKALVSVLKLNDSVIFGDARPRDIIGKYYQLGDVFVTASTSETQGLTHIEAMAARIPVIAKKDKSFEDVISHRETGYCFENDDELPELLYEVLSNKEEAANIAERAYNNISHLSAQNFALSIEKLYEEVIGNYKYKKQKRNILSEYNLDL